MSSKKKTTTQKVTKKEVVKTSEKKVAKKVPRVQVADFSAGKVKSTFGFGIIALILLAIFPYKSITREHGSYSLLIENYYKKLENRFVYNQTLAMAPRQVEAATSVPIVMYHGVMSRPDAYNLHRKNFEEHLNALKMDGWQTITMDEFRAFRKGEMSLPAKSFLLTFDDGRKDSYYPVDPLLERFGYSAVMFTLPQYSIDHESISPYYLNRNHIEQMHSSGRWDIESHTWDGHSFFPLDADGLEDGIFLANLLWREDLGRKETENDFRMRVRDDLLKADASIKALSGQDVTTVAFPFGNYGNTNYNFSGAQEIVLDEAQKVHDLGFSQVRTGIFLGHGLSANYADEDDFLVERIDVNPLWNGSDLIAVLDGGADKALPYQADMHEYVGWIAPSGLMRHEKKSIILETTEIHPRAAAFLDGTSMWKDYRFDLDLQWEQGEKLVLRTHGTLADGGVACVYEREKMYVIADGVRRDLATIFYDDAITRGSIKISAEASSLGGVCRIGNIELPFVLGGDVNFLGAGVVSVEVHDSRLNEVEGNILTRLLAKQSPTDSSLEDREKGLIILDSFRAVSAISSTPPAGSLNSSP